MMFMLGMGPKEIKTIEDWVCCVKGMPDYNVDEETREKVNASVKRAIENFEKERPEREMNKALEKMKLYSQMGEVYLKSSDEHDIAMGYEFASKARAGMKDISLLATKDHKEYTRLNELTLKLTNDAYAAKARLATPSGGSSCGCGGCK